MSHQLHIRMQLFTLQRPHLQLSLTCLPQHAVLKSNLRILMYRDGDMLHSAHGSGAAGSRSCHKHLQVGPPAAGSCTCAPEPRPLTAVHPEHPSAPVQHPAWSASAPSPACRPTSHDRSDATAGLRGSPAVLKRKQRQIFTVDTCNQLLVHCGSLQARCPQLTHFVIMLISTSCTSCTCS